MKKLLSIVFLFVLLLVSCTSSKEIPTATVLPTSTLSPTATATERPNAKLKSDTVLYAGPGNVDFDSIGNLKAGDTVYPLGTYGDFIQVEASVDGNNSTGFIYKNVLDNLPSNIPALDASAVPLKPFYMPDCSGGAYDSATDTVTFTNQSDGYYDQETKAIKLDEPLRIKIGKLSAQGTSYNIVKILGIPEIQDPWWKGIIRLDISNNGGYYQIGARDGTTEGYNAQWDLSISSSQPVQIIFDQVEGKSFTVFDKDGKEVKHIDLTQQSQLNLPNGLFPNGVTYIGTSTAPHSSSMVTGLNVGVVPNGTWIDQPDNGPGLADLAKKYNLTIGNGFSIWDNEDMRYCRIMKRDFNVEAIGDFSWKGYWLGPDQYDFSVLDHEVDYANRMGWRTRAMHLVWGAVESDAIPDWLLNGHFTRDQYIQILEQHVKTIVTRYKGRVQEWSIANEASSRSFYPGADFWNDKIGPDYIEMAFRWAREADPNGILIFNDLNNESPRDLLTSRTIDKMYNTVKNLKEKGVPIDVVGMQMHLLLKYSSPIPPQKADVIATMQKFASLGVRIYITEFDVDLSKQPGTQTEKWNYQAQLYRDMLDACLESKVCDSFTTWGISDSTSWITCQQPGCVNEPNADPLMFDKDFNPKPAYFAVRDVLTNFPNIIPTPTP